MTAFVLLAGLLLVGSLLWILPPLFRARAHGAERDLQSQIALKVLREHLAEVDAELASGRIDAATHARSREELERRALEEGQASARAAQAEQHRIERGWGLGLAAGVSVLAIAGYLMLGNPDGLDPEKVAGQQGFTPAQIADMVGTLAARLDADPDNAEGWSMLARSYMVLQDYPKAASAYQRASALMPGNADVLADWADAVAVVRGTVAGESEALAERALQIAPDHPKALAISGTGAYQRQAFALAAERWEKVLAQLPADAEVSAGIRNSVNDARAKAGLPPLEAHPAAATAAPPPTLTLNGRLEIAPELSERYGPDDAVFVFVRAQGGGPPLAALRFRAAELPTDFSFDGAALMAGEVPIPELVSLGARLSRGGNATARSGDLEGFVAGLAPQAAGVVLRIDRVRE